MLNIELSTGHPILVKAYYELPECNDEKINELLQLAYKAGVTEARESMQNHLMDFYQADWVGAFLPIKIIDR